MNDIASAATRHYLQGYLDGQQAAYWRTREHLYRNGLDRFSPDQLEAIWWVMGVVEQIINDQHDRRECYDTP